MCWKRNIGLGMKQNYFKFVVDYECYLFFYCVMLLHIAKGIYDILAIF